jgi:hypothetical protein
LHFFIKFYAPFAFKGETSYLSNLFVSYQAFIKDLDQKKVSFS